MQERRAAAEFPGLVKPPTETNRRILLCQKAGSPAKSRGEAADIVLAINIAHNAKKVPMHLRLQCMTYDEKGNLSGILEITETSGMVRPTMSKVILMAPRRVNLNIINATRD